MPLQIEPETASDVSAIRGVVGAAFADEPAVVDLVDAIRDSAQYEPTLSLVARLEGEVVGFVMVSHAALIDDGNHGASNPVGAPGEQRHDVLTLSPLAVAPERQGRGIGSALVRTVLATAETTDAPLIVLEGSPRYYRRFGFRPAAESGIGMRLPDWAPADAAQVYLLPSYRPAVRGRVRYPPAFDIVT